MVHWSKTSNANEVRRRISEKRKGKGLGNTNGFQIGKTSWNKNLPKEKQPRYDKPISDNQRKAVMENFSIKGEEPWNKNLSEWSPRANDIQRIKALIRDNFKCVQCNNDEQLIVHHIKHWKQIDDKTTIHNKENLITLCRSCHQSIHNKQKIKIMEEN